MKKVVLILGVISMFAIASCSKEKTCKCVTTTTGLPDVEQVLTIQDGSCSDLNTEATTAGVTAKMTCTEQ